MSPTEFMEEYEEEKVKAGCAENIGHINSEVKPFFVCTKKTCTYLNIKLPKVNEEPY
jgi:NRPS condensation-like uncharacterized protein